MIQRPARVALHLPGGGARGAYQVGAMQAIGEICQSVNTSPFHIYTGISAGAINAAVMASHADDFQQGVQRLSAFWNNMRCDHIYRTDWANVLASITRWVGAALFGRLGVRAPAALLNTAPLRALLQRETVLERIPGLIDDGVFDSVAVSASGYSTGTAVSFYQSQTTPPWHRGRRRGRKDTLTVDHLMASTALPLLFPPQKIRHEFFGDGSLRQTAPLSTPIHLGADRILIISARDAAEDPEPTKAPCSPSAGEIAGHLLDIVFMDNLDADLERLNRINDTLRQLSTEKRQENDLRIVETLTIRPSKDLRALVGEHVTQMPSSVKILLAGVGAWRSDHRLASYLLFEQDYCQALMSLGYDDAIKQKDSIQDLMRGFS
ncbi:MAG: patatin-like phospholipase family protein [Lysobacterales bacterium]